MEKFEFLTFLVDETLKLQGSGEQRLSSLELKLTDYRLDFLKGEFIPQTQVLRFTTPFGVLDVPMNWGLFSCEGTHFSVIDAKSDSEGFFHVIKAAWKLPLDKLLILHADGFCYLVALKTGEDTHLRDLIHQHEWLKTG